MSRAERVYAVFDYWDGPRVGVADFEGRPHAFRCIFDEIIDDWTDNFRLKPLSTEELEAVMRDWAIWLRWKAAFDEGRTSKATHPALPEDTQEHEEVGPLVSAAFEIPERAQIAHGTFEAAGRNGELLVRWLPPRLLPRRSD